jgi:hypothetical protein
MKIGVYIQLLDVQTESLDELKVCDHPSAPDSIIM